MYSCERLFSNFFLSFSSRSSLYYSLAFESSILQNSDAAAAAGVSLADAVVTNAGKRPGVVGLDPQQQNTIMSRSDATLARLVSSALVRRPVSSVNAYHFLNVVLHILVQLGYQLVATNSMYITAPQMSSRGRMVLQKARIFA